MKLILCVEQVCVNLMCLIRENMNKILKWFVGSVMVLALVGAWTVWITERFYRHGYREGRLEYFMDDKERFGLREWLKEHPEDTEKFLVIAKALMTMSRPSNIQLFGLRQIIGFSHCKTLHNLPRNKQP